MDASSNNSSCIARSLSRTRVRGSIAVNTAIALSLIIIVLIGTELGYAFYMKREMQKSADLAALAGAQALQPDFPNSCDKATGAAIANAKQNFPAGISFPDPVVNCGRWDPISRPTSPHFGPPNSGEKLNAVQVTINSPPLLLLPGIPGNQARTVIVEAMAAQTYPRAALNIRSTLVEVDSTQSELLNAVLGGLLGGKLTLDVAGWNGLLNTNIQLLSFLDQLAINLNISAGHYDEVLNAQVSVGQLVQAAIKVLERNGSTAQVAIDALNGIKLAADVEPVELQLGDLLGVQTGTSAAGLDTNIQLFQLLQGVIQLANGKNALIASVPITIPGVLGVTANVKIIEPPQVSAIGDPTLAALDPTGPDQIYVRTAQIRTLISIDLPVLSGLHELVNAVTELLAPVTDLLNNVLHLDILGVLSNVLNCVGGCTRNLTDIQLLPAPRLDISLDAGGGASRVTKFSCPADAKSLTTSTTTSVANLSIGSLGATTELAKANAFASKTPPTVATVPILDIGRLQCKLGPLGLIKLSCDQPNRIAFYGGGLGLMANVPIGATTEPQVFSAPPPPELNQQPSYQAISTQNIIESLSSTLGGLNLLTAIPPKAGVPPGGLAGVLEGLTQTLSGVIGLLQGVVSNVLSPLLDPLVNMLIGNVLGANLAKTEVGARLSCSTGAELVY